MVTHVLEKYVTLTIFSTDILKVETFSNSDTELINEFLSLHLFHVSSICERTNHQSIRSFRRRLEAELFERTGCHPKVAIL